MQDFYSDTKIVNAKAIHKKIDLFAIHNFSNSLRRGADFQVCD